MTNQFTEERKLTPEKNGQGLIFEIIQCPACFQKVKVGLAHGEIYSHQKSRWSTEICEESGIQISKFAIGIKVGDPELPKIKNNTSITRTPILDQTRTSIKPIYIGKHRS